MGNKITSSLSKMLSNRDLFGHPIQLNFNKSGPTHKTPFGGILSMFISVVILAYFGLNIKKMILFENDKVTERVKRQNLELLGDIEFKDTRFFMSYVL